MGQGGGGKFKREGKHTHTYKDIYTHTHIKIYTHTHIKIYTHTHTYL